MDWAADIVIYENDAVEHPGAIRQRMDGLDLASPRRQPQDFWRDMHEPRGLAEIELRLLPNL